MFLILMFGLLIGLVFVAAKAQGRFDRWNQAFAYVARRFGGRLTSGGWFSNPSVWMPYASTHGRLTTYTLQGSQGPRCLELVVQLNEVRFHCEISLRQAKNRLSSSATDLHPFALEWDDFGRRWQVLCDDGDEARLLLGNGVRWQIDQLWQHPERTDLLVIAMPGWLVIRKYWHSSRAVDVEQFVEQAFGLYDQVLLTKTVGIEFVESDEMQVIDDAQCRICGDAFQVEIVCCRRCKTPHHRECWEYNGGCSTYACRETVFVVPQTAQPILPGGPAGLHAEQHRPAKPR